MEILISNYCFRNLKRLIIHVIVFIFYLKYKCMILSYIYISLFSIICDLPWFPNYFTGIAKSISINLMMMIIKRNINMGYKEIISVDKGKIFTVLIICKLSQYTFLKILWIKDITTDFTQIVFSKFFSSVVVADTSFLLK